MTNKSSGSVSLLTYLKKNVQKSRHPTQFRLVPEVTCGPFTGFHRVFWCQKGGTFSITHRQIRPRQSACLVLLVTLGTRPDLNCCPRSAPRKTFLAPPPVALLGRAADLINYKNNYLIQLTIQWSRNILMKINDFEQTNSATIHLQSFPTGLIPFFKKPSDGRNKEQMSAEVAVRRAEEIKHLTGACGFVFQQIKSIQLKAEGRKEKHDNNARKNLFAFNGLGN